MSKAETDNILSKYLSELYTFSQLGLYTKMSHFFFQPANILSFRYNSHWTDASSLSQVFWLSRETSFNCDFEGNNIHCASVCWQ